MIEVHPNLFVGSDVDVEGLKGNWSFIHAAKEPWHRQALGYTTRGAPKDHPQYLYAQTSERELALNLIDADNPEYIPEPVIEKALQFIDLRLNVGDKVLVHCNQGHSRGPGIAFLYMKENGFLPLDQIQAHDKFIALYPEFKPAEGIRQFILSKYDNSSNELSSISLPTKDLVEQNIPSLVSEIFEPKTDLKPKNGREQAELKRSENGFFVPGTAPGPGRPPNVVSPTAAYKQILAEKGANALAETVYNDALTARNARDRLAAAAEIADRVDGKATQRVDMRGVVVMVPAEGALGALDSWAGDEE